MTLITGPSRMSTPLLLASVPSAAASAWTSRGSQVAPSADGQGRLAAGLRSSMVTPRTPAGPSDTTMARSPMAGSGQVLQLSAPVSRRTLSSRLSAASRSASGTALFIVGLRGSSPARASPPVPAGAAGVRAAAALPAYQRDRQDDVAGRQGLPAEHRVQHVEG